MSFDVFLEICPTGMRAPMGDLMVCGDVNKTVSLQPGFSFGFGHGRIVFVIGTGRIFDVAHRVSVI